ERGEGRPVGGERQVGAERGELLDEHRQLGAHGGLTAGEADAVEAVALDEQPRDPLDLLEGEELVAGEPFHALGRHAVRAAEVAPVGDRDAQVAVDPSEAVGEGERSTAGYGVCHPGATPPGQSGGAVARSPSTMTGIVPSGGTPSPSASTPRPSAAAMADSWWEPWPPEERATIVPSAATDRRTRTKWVLPSGVRLSPSGTVAGSTARPQVAWPIIVRRAGRANSSKETIDDTGLPGNPNTGTPPTVPTASGFAGRIATCIHSMSPRSSSTAFTRSKSPILTPPEVTSA